jgi:hypothetical protein
MTIKLRAPGIAPGVYSMDFVLKQINYNDNKGRVPVSLVNAKHVGRPRNQVKATHAEAMRKWRAGHQELVRKNKEKWLAYNRALTGFRKLFGDDNQRIKQRTCKYCGSIDNVHLRNGSYFCVLCMCKHEMSLACKNGVAFA